MTRIDENAEILSVVDEYDIIIGQERRDKIHSKNLLHRSIHVLIFNSRDEIFLQQRSVMKQESPGLWASSVSGHVDAGESYDEACIREIEEEVGLKIDETPKKLFKMEPSILTANEFSWVYFLETDEELFLNSEELENGIWLNQESLNNLILANSNNIAELFIYIWKKYCKLQNN